jgi:hypothetical protein
MIEGKLELTARFTIRRMPEVRQLAIYIITDMEGGFCTMHDFTIDPGTSKRFEVHGFDENDVDIGIVPATVISSDNHTLQVNDKGDGTGTVDAVGTAGASADVSADDGQGHTDKATGTITTPPAVARIELQFFDPAT